ncbi:unnamed protein product [Blepharisma stoltei]|uniref:Uncharacterized protein n=1 Tax=Blepharisma stoltei TaxID=1481888 RepID=A0AAU9IP84_9CILI|nr:unnamed protein product [Blepharisma stoltei]
MEGYFAVEAKPRSWKKGLAIFGALAIIGTIAALAAFSAQKQVPLALAQIELEEGEFKSFMAFYNKQYSTEEEYQRRFRIFRDNAAYARVFNTLGETYLLGINEFSDLTAKEFSDRVSRPFDHSKVTKNVKWIESLSIPSSIDWTQQGAVTPVLNQGQCGSCWSFSAAGAIEGIWKISRGILIAVSEQQLIDCSTLYGNKGCEGGTVNYAFEYVIKNGGITSSSNYPYIGKQGTCKNYLASQKFVAISSYANVPANNVDQLYKAVAQQPVSVAVDAGQAFWQSYKSGIVSSGCGTQLDHSVLIVGYNQTNWQPYWKVKNSWGAFWGEAGYIRIAVVNGKGACGIQMMPSYPIF